MLFLLCIDNLNITSVKDNLVRMTFEIKINITNLFQKANDNWIVVLC